MPTGMPTGIFKRVPACPQGCRIVVAKEAFSQEAHPPLISTSIGGKPSVFWLPGQAFLAA
eukprot:1156462-Pelagomonas_calceolata.AAC.2